MRLITVGASAGGIGAHRTLLGGFSHDLDVTVLDRISGLLAVIQGGGTTVIQDLADAEAPCLPSSARRRAEIHCQATLAAMASLVRLANAPTV